VQKFLGLVRRYFIPAERQILGDDLLHLGFNLGQVLLLKAIRELKIVEETVFDDRPNGVLNAGPIEPSQRLRQHVSGAVAHDVKTVGIAIGDDLHVMLAGQRMG
jgi:hypothetical protein